MYDAHDPLVVAGILALVIKMVTTYPPVVFCGRDTIVRLLISRKRQKQFEYQAISAGGEGSGDAVDAPILSQPPTTPEFSCRSKTYHFGITSVWNVVVLMLAIVTPNITVAIGFLGSLASCNVFIFPGLALVALSRRYIKLRRSLEEEEETEECHRQQQSMSEQDHLISGGHHSSTSTSYFSRTNKSPSIFSLSNKWTQAVLMLYGLFIIAMGIIMFIIILIQVYRDFQNPIPHGAVCDGSAGGIVDVVLNSTTTLAPLTTL